MFLDPRVLLKGFSPLTASPQTIFCLPNQLNFPGFVRSQAIEFDAEVAPAGTSVEAHHDDPAQRHFLFVRLYGDTKHRTRQGVIHALLYPSYADPSHQFLRSKLAIFSRRSGVPSTSISSD
jgi:hypothetical protein